METTGLRDPDGDGEEAVPHANGADQITPEEYNAYLKDQAFNQVFDPAKHISVPLLMELFPDVGEKRIRNQVKKDVDEGKLLYIGKLYDPQRERPVKAYRAVANGRIHHQGMAGGS
jgi:hypothetical protein